MDFVTFVLQVIIGLAIGRFIGKFVIELLTRKDVEAEKEKLVQKVMQQVHRIKQEKHGDLFYWFDADSDQFLAQGQTDEEIRKHLLGRFKGHIFLIDNEKAMAGPDLKIVPISSLTANT